MLLLLPILARVVLPIRPKLRLLSLPLATLRPATYSLVATQPLSLAQLLAILDNSKLFMIREVARLIRIRLYYTISRV
jgi:hypothetical protein